MGAGNSRNPRLSVRSKNDLMKTSAMSESELEQVWKTWTNKHPSGLVTLKEFNKTMETLLPKMPKQSIR